MSNSTKPNLILTSSFNTVVNELLKKELLPKRASVVFIGTASNPYTEHPWVERDRNVLVGLGYEVVDVDLESKSIETLRNAFASADIIFVAGGNTTYLNTQSHLSGFHNLIRDLLGQGKIYIGSSAGSLLAGPSIEPFVEEDLLELPTDIVLADPMCLGLVDYIILPHYPLLAKENDAVTEKYADRFQFKKMTDHEYVVETV